MSETANQEETAKKLRAEIRRQAAETYASIPMKMLDWITLGLFELRGAFKKKKDGQENTRVPFSRQDLGSYAWQSAILIGLLVLLVGALVAWWAGELKTVQLPEIALSNRDNFLKSVASLGSFLKPWWFHLWLIVLACLTMLGSRAAFARFLSVFPKKPLEAMDSADDLKELKTWLDKNTRSKQYVLISFPVGILLGLILLLAWQYAHLDKSPPASLVVVSIISSILGMLAWSYIVPFYIVLPSKLGNYHFRLFANDPSSSAEIKDLENMYTYIMLITMGVLTFFTLGMIVFQLFPDTNLLFMMLLFAWGPTIAFFFISQSNINKTIVTNKWAALDALQHQIEALYNLSCINSIDPGEIPKKEELERLDKLVGLYEQVKGYPNGSLNLRGIFNAITILLLPLITWILTYQETIRNLINQIIQGPSGRSQP